MKRSVFTVEYKNDDGRSVLFNTFNGALALVGKNATQQDLARGGFLAKDGVDEEALLSARFLKDMNETSFLTLCIAPTMACNLRCVYCYEEHEPIRMSDEVEEAVLRFVRRRYDRYRFEDLEILWYGGEPLLEIERMESLTRKLTGWCAGHGVRYHASITTNATLVDSSVASRLEKMGIANAMPTLDGCEHHHDLRRPKASKGGSYHETLAGIEALSAAGIHVDANLNLGWDTVDDYRGLSDEIGKLPGCSLYASHLRNYGNWCPSCGEGCSLPPASKPDHGPSLMSREAYAKQLFELYRESDPSAAAIAESLRPKRAFCHGKMASYFVIDPEGYTYRCDGHMRDPKYRLFNVLDSEADLDWPETLDPYERNPRCKGCAIMPLCLGDCDWEWGMFEENCSALKYTLEDYVRLLVEKTALSLDSGECILQIIEPIDVEERFAAPFSPFNGEGVMG